MPDRVSHLVNGTIAGRGNGTQKAFSRQAHKQDSLKCRERKDQSHCCWRWSRPNLDQGLQDPVLPHQEKQIVERAIQMIDGVPPASPESDQFSMLTGAKQSQRIPASSFTAFLPKMAERNALAKGSTSQATQSSGPARPQCHACRR